MKKTVKTSRVAGQLEKMYRLLNIRFFNGELPEVVISLKKTVGACGHFTCSKDEELTHQERQSSGIRQPSIYTVLPRRLEAFFVAGNQDG